MLLQYSPPSRWWRRGKTIALTIWPDWIAQVLCPHLRMVAYMWGDNEIWEQCSDCHKRIVRGNTCEHVHRTVSAWERLDDGREVPVQYCCDDCGSPIAAHRNGV